MFTGRMLSLFVMALVIFYPMGNVWAQTTTNRSRTQTTGFGADFFPTEITITPLPEERVVSFENLSGKHWQSGFTLKLDDVMQRLLEDTTCRVSFIDSWIYMPDPRAEAPDEQNFNLQLGVGSFLCTVNARQNREQQKITFQATYILDAGSLLGVVNSRMGDRCKGFPIPISLQMDDDGDVKVGIFFENPF